MPSITKELKLPAFEPGVAASRRPAVLGFVETANGAQVQLNAQPWTVGQHACSVFNNDWLLEDRVPKRVVAYVVLNQRRLHDIPTVRIIGQRCNEMAGRRQPDSTSPHMWR